MKFIVMNEINDNDANVDGFVEIAKKTKANVVISRDSRAISERMTDSERHAAERMLNKCKYLKIPVFIAEDYIRNQLN